jgi:hypothetical protein
MRDVERWHEWTASITAIDRLDAGPFGTGSRVRIRQPGFPAAQWTVTAFDEGRGFTWVTRYPGFQASGHHRVERLASGSRATLAVRFEGALGGVAGWIMRGVNRRFLGFEAAGLKRRAEGAVRWSGEAR